MLRTASLCLLALTVAAPAKNYTAGRFDVSLTVERGGALLVSEAVVFDFRGGPFTYVYRDVPAARTDGIAILNALMDGRALTFGTAPGQVEVKGSDPIRVTWHFDPIADSAHSFVLTYRALGAVCKKADGDSLLWRAIPERHPYEIAAGTIRLTHPESAAFVRPARLLGAAASPDTAANMVEFPLGSLRRNRSVRVDAVFRPGSLIASAPAWQQRGMEASAAARRLAGLSVMAGLGVLAAGLFAIFQIRASFRRRLEVPRSLEASASPPASLPPAIAGFLVRGESQNLAAFAMATVYDLARRGAVRIEEAEHARFRGRRFDLIRQAVTGSIAPHEQALLHALFEADGEPSGRARLSQVPRALLRDRGGYGQALRSELTASGMLDPDRQQRRQQVKYTFLLVVIAGILMVTGAAIGLAQAPRALMAALLGGGCGLFVVGIIGLAVSAALSPLTDQGAMVAAGWRAFERHLRNVARGRTPAGAEMFDQYLAYATAFGLADGWANRFRKLGNVPVPAWFHTHSAADGSEAAALATMIASSSHSSHGGGTGGGGGGGASGGGASGAG